MDIQKVLELNVSALFTIMTEHREFYKKWADELVNCFSINKEKEIQDELYFILKYTDELDNDIDLYFSNHPGFIDKVYINDHIMITCDKFTYMSEREWDLLKQSKYSLFRDKIYEGCCRVNKNFVSSTIIFEDKRIRESLEKHIGEELEENIYWKSFNEEQEILNIEIIEDMVEMKYKRSWILKKIQEAPTVIHKEVYEDVYKHSKESSETPIKQVTIDYQKIYDNIQQALIKKCGKPQFQIAINGTNYPFMCNYPDFEFKMKKVCKKYKLEDTAKIEKVLIDHINKLKAPILKYFIDKNNVSALADNYSNYIESTEVKPQTFEI